MKLEFTPEMVGRPFTWRTAVYGDIAVHVEKFSPNGAVANLTIDGGEAATPAQRFPELADGIGFAVQGQLIRRVRTSIKRNRGKAAAAAPNNNEVNF